MRPFLVETSATVEDLRVQTTTTNEGKIELTPTNSERE